jgi:hypothetical protein
MTVFKPGDRVVCIDPGPKANELTFNKEYIVANFISARDTYPDSVMLEGHGHRNNLNRGVYARRFKLVSLDPLDMIDRLDLASQE